MVTIHGLLNGGAQQRTPFSGHGNHRASIGAEQEGLGPPNALRLPVTRLGSGHPQQTHR